MRPDGGAIEKGHPKRDVVLLDEIEQTFPDPLLGPANEQLCGQPPWTQFGGDTAPLRAILVPPENRRNRPPQLFGRRLSPWPDRLNQRFPYRPRRICENLIAVSFRHPQKMGTVLKL